MIYVVQLDIETMQISPKVTWLEHSQFPKICSRLY